MDFARLPAHIPATRAAAINDQCGSLRKSHEVLRTTETCAFVPAYESAIGTDSAAQGLQHLFLQSPDDVSSSFGDGSQYGLLDERFEKQIVIVFVERVPAVLYYHATAQ